MLCHQADVPSTGRCYLGARFTPMSFQTLQTQISKMQSQLDAKRSRLRSKTPKKHKESMNSAQRRRKNNSDKKAPPASRVMKQHPADQQKLAVQNKWIDPQTVLTKSMDMAPMHVKAKFIDLWGKFCKAQKRATDAGLTTWDPQVRVPGLDESLTRFQKFSEWKSTVKKNESLTKAIVCDHVFMDEKSVKNPAVLPFLTCMKCGVKRGDIKDEKQNDVIIQQLTELYEAACQEFEVARDMLRAGLKNKPIRMQLTASVTITTTVATGVTNTIVFNSNTQALVQSDGTEWSSVKGLFDETKLTGGRIEFLYVNSINANGTTSAVGQNSTPSIGYDPGELSAVSSGVSDIVSMAQHEQISPLVTVGGAAAAVPANGIKHSFKWRVPPGTEIPSATQGIVIGNDWQSTEGTLLPVGSIKFYHIGTCVTATNTGAGTIFYHCEFRCRE